MRTHAMTKKPRWPKLLLPMGILLLSACTESNGPETTTTSPADSYFALAVTENSHNHTGARILLLDFMEAAPAAGAGSGNVVISPRINNAAITADGDSADWNSANLTTIKGLVQNNYPLSQFIDAAPTDITVGSAWDDDYIYFLVQWEDAGHTQSTQYRKWIYGDQGNGETGWTAKAHIGAGSGTPNESAANASHVLAGSEDEDRVYLMFPITDSSNAFAAYGLGCAAFCHANLSSDNPFQNYTGTDVAAMHTNNSGDKADIWQWKSSRSEPAGFADDLLLSYAQGSNNGFMPDAGSATYADNTLNGNSPASMHTSGLGYTGDVLLQAQAIAFNGSPGTGDQIPAIITQTPGGSRADIASGASYDPASGRWTVEFRRLRDTGHADDRQFVPGTDAQPLTIPVVTDTDTTAGSTLYGNLCESCHKTNGIGSLSGNSWQYPRIQRTSGSLIVKATQTVSAMAGISLTHQQAEDIAAFLQSQDTFSATYRLNTVISGISSPLPGTVTSSQPGITCPGSCDYNFLPGASITLNANDISGYVFSGWSGTSCSEGSQTGATCSFTLNSDQNITAAYTPTTVTYTLTVTSGANGSVSSTPAGITCAPSSVCAAQFSEGATVTLTATPETNYRLDAWSGDCSGSAGCNVNMTADRNITAAFAQSQGTATPCVVSGAPPTIPDISVLEVVRGLSNPVHITNAGDGSNRLFIVEQRGTVRIVQNGTLQAGNFLDIQDRVSFGGERGLLSIAFHPDFTSNERFYVNYTSDSQCASSSLCTIVSEFTVGATATLEDSERIILDIDQPAVNHNGGQIAFGPEPNPYLYIGMGDGGGGGDPDGNGQDLTTLLGAMLRIDINNKDSGLEYAIPADNPAWSGVSGARREIWAYGLRNPWRFSFDPVTGDLYAADVGQSAREEVDIIRKGLNYGWNRVEGDICYSDKYPNCDLNAYEPPIIAPPRSEGWYSITGGMVYRGSDIPDLCGVYLYGDYVADYVRGLRYDGANGTSALKVFSPTVNSLSSFGYDESYEVYALNRDSGRLYKISQ